MVGRTCNFVHKLPSSLRGRKIQGLFAGRERRLAGPSKPGRQLGSAGHARGLECHGRCKNEMAADGDTRWTGEPPGGRVCSSSVFLAAPTSSTGT